MKLILKAKYKSKKRGKNGKWEYTYATTTAPRRSSSNTPDSAMSRLEATAAMRQAARDNVNTPPPNVKMDSKTKKKVSRALQAAVPESYTEGIPIERLDEALRSEGYLLVQEDGTPWSGMLFGADSQALFRVGELGTERSVNGLDMYSTVENTALSVSWYKMPSGKYEIVHYMSL